MINKTDYISKLSNNSELLNFAKHFSNTYTTLSTGTYHSENNKYQIEFTEKFIDLITPVRVGNSSGKIEIARNIIMNEEYTPDFIFYMIIWSVIKFDLTKIESDYESAYELADEIATDFYLTTKRSPKNLLKGYIILLSITNLDSNKRRYKMVENIVKKKKGSYFLVALTNGVILASYTLFMPYILDSNYVNNGSLHINIQFLLLWTAFTLITFGIDIIYNKIKK